MRESLNKFILGTASVSPEEAKPVNCHEITPNPFQPRQNFSEENLAELAQSIKTYGLLQPILVRRHEKGVPNWWPVSAGCGPANYWAGSKSRQ